jgi:hypothetical protein
MGDVVTAEYSGSTTRTVWPRLDDWASTRRYRLTDWHANSRVYKKSHPLRRRRGCWIVSIDQERGKLHVAGSVRPMRLAGGRTAPAAVSAARADVGWLLDSLGDRSAD